MIMRHCDKEVEVKVHGKKRTMDTVDGHGRRHCSPKGRERSEYIATLFVDPDDYQDLVEKSGLQREVEDGIPPVPMIKSSLSGNHHAAKEKPQFPTPDKLYALAKERQMDERKPSKGHENWREIETITPLSKKFHLDVDDRFGVGDEGELASDFFESLSQSVTESVGKMMLTSSANSTEQESARERYNLCDDGMAVVNWKHSRIPTLAQALGCGKNEGCPAKYKGSDFDTMWLLTFQYSLELEGLKDAADLDVRSSFLSLESLSKSSWGNHRALRHRSKEIKHSGGRWKVSAELVNEGFDSN
jgi:hypothetical protein